MKWNRLLLVMIIALLFALLLHGCQSGAPAVTLETTEAPATTTVAPETTEATVTELPTISTESIQDTEAVPTEAPIETEIPTEPVTEAPTEPGPTEPKPTEPQPTEPQPTEPKPTEPKPTNPVHTHSWGGWTQTQAPTCGAAGTETRTCNCGAKESRTVNALGHNWSGWTQTQAPTCGAAGTESRSCSRCGQTETRTVAATGNHSWTETAPTCTAAGAKTCKICCASETIAALGHDWVHHAEEGHWRDVLTCRCGAVFYTYEEWNNHMHSYLDTEEEGNHTGYSGTGEWIVDVSAYDSCSRCGAVK